MGLLLQIGITVFLLAMGYYWGTRAEKKHYRDIVRREQHFTDVVVVTSKHAPAAANGGELVQGNVVVASDYFKQFVSWLIGIFGGRMNVYESLLDRARREAVLRVKASARAQGANLVVNLKFETATLNDIGKRNAAMVEVLAYGTAVRLPESAAT